MIIIPYMRQIALKFLTARARAPLLHLIYYTNKPSISS